MTLDPNGPDDPNGPEGVDTEGKAVPPYEGRRESADVGGRQESSRDGAGSPSDEQPAG